MNNEIREDLYKEKYKKNITEYKKYKINDTKTNIEITFEKTKEKKIYYLEYLVLLGCDTLHLYNLIIIHNSIRNINTSPQII